MDGTDRSFDHQRVELNPLEWTLWAYLGLATLYATAIDERSRQQDALKQWNKSVAANVRKKSTLDLWEDSLVRRAKWNKLNSVSDCDARGFTKEMLVEEAGIKGEKHHRKQHGKRAIGMGSEGYLAAFEAMTSGRFDDSKGSIKGYLFSTSRRAIGNALLAESNDLQSRPGGPNWTPPETIPMDGHSSHLRPLRDNSAKAIATASAMADLYQTPFPSFVSVADEDGLWGLSASSVLAMADERLAEAGISDVDAQMYLDYHYHNLKQGEIAKKFGMSQSTVSSRIAKTMERLGEPL